VVIALLKGGADANIQDKKSGKTALMHAAHRSNPKLTNALLKSGADVNARTHRGETALMWALRRSPRLLADAGGGANAKDAPALMEGETDNVLRIISLLLKAGADVNAQDNDGRTPLMWSWAFYGKPEKIVAALLENGASATLKDNAGLTAADYAEKSRIPSSAKISRKLRKFGIPLNTWKFFKLCETGTPQEVMASIEAGANVNARYNVRYDFERETALMRAVQKNGNPAVAETLIRFGADMGARDVYDQTILMHGVLNNNPEMTSMLLSAGADVAARSIHYETPLMVALWDGGNPEVISILLDAGSDIEARGDAGMTPLMHAVYGENIRSIEILRKRGADVNARDNYEQTALIRAAMHCENPEIIETLLEAGADIGHKDEEGCSAIDYAEKNPKLCDTNTLQKLHEGINNKPLTVCWDKIREKHAEFLKLYGDQIDIISLD
jgi:ankyrin repeat protein